MVLFFVQISCPRIQAQERNRPLLELFQILALCATVGMIESDALFIAWP